MNLILFSAAGGSLEPDSFSCIDLASMSNAQIRRKFPRFPGRSAATVVELHAGEALYLPAGYFHEVRKRVCRVHTAMCLSLKLHL